MATEDERIRMLDEGFAVVGTMRTVRSIGVDHDVVEYAKARGLVVRIDRQTDWGNPFPMASEDERDLVCERYESYVRANPELMARVPSLKGKLLLCWCHPRRCHGDTLAALANEMSTMSTNEGEVK
ncbi:DUF4326 domain-containing protein [Sinorhizobium medicae]|uniref:DUF4326 domain-containing protein n=1 Tax=Sinorhizobium medicae TaxID=110321 RepID=UPI00041AE73F|nr:DUF4326 domain-containing protein [Sinorhizobium medicae]MDX0431149.1 DUF4326 domain-containing protein [Sinorhizobium medicae]MDX0442312.1 DUF4326 domain-containing protein [Sinorhizobium medicae]MDX0463846.1 DUF4326 domain-containing protein [Sinorhizobium medicae]MDX0537641.1 DUF4326 domain-containing protein [Sinorhizobium medicae]MDX0572412.1 DUF4326 domain-containing protein [Sinorhizobium medicae]